MSSRQYDLVVFGATGYTGKLTAEHITTHLPTDLRWALAGRSATKLEAVAAECKTLNPDRIQPAIEVCKLDDTDLSALAKKTKVLITTVGPYGMYGEHAFKACAENGTHYLDVTGEIPFVRDMIRKYETTAKKNGCIMIPQIGIESAPADLVTWTLVDMIRKKLSAPTGEVIVSVHDLTSSPSGGTLNSVLSLMDTWSLKDIATAHEPGSLSPIPVPKAQSYKSIVTKIFGFRSVSDLGILTSSLGGTADRPIIYRSWALLGGDKTYGPNFHFSEYMKARNYLGAIAIHFGLMIGSVLLAIPLFRTIARKYVVKPGDGPTREQYKNDRVEYRGIGIPDVQTPNPPKAFCRVKFEGSLYAYTGLSVAQAAVSILRDGHDLSGGIYTPACLGQKFIDRLDEVGFQFERKFYDN
ncbi:Saccharopine dehydrogenase-domain-containing protein [Cadophora sp. MPI-SDFR-AT-0126]|nr:Saccharopine dehydrogenase-domain-containing protein [Leotiomycetes sp. MPI-SDFR-AT-0126]